MGAYGHKDKPKEKLVTNPLYSTVHVTSLSSKPTYAKPWFEVFGSIPKPKFRGTREDLFRAYLILSHNNDGVPMDVVRYIIMLALKDGRWFEYEHDFDKNGILYYLGTDEGKKTYYGFPRDYVKVFPTPIFQGSVEQAFKWSGEAPKIVQNWCYKGWADNQKSMHGELWFSIEFLNHTVVPTKYTIRHGYPGGHALRNWNFEATNDGKKWKVLESYKDNKKMGDRDLNCTATFEIPADKRDAYNRFRIFVTGVTDQQSYYLMMAGFEIYGFLQNEKRKD
jgi:E3 ubiquitin-protein ligase HECTD1